MKAIDPDLQITQPLGQDVASSPRAATSPKASPKPQIGRSMRKSLSPGKRSMIQRRKMMASGVNRGLADQKWGGEETEFLVEF